MLKSKNFYLFHDKISLSLLAEVHYKCFYMDEKKSNESDPVI